MPPSIKQLLCIFNHVKQKQMSILARNDQCVYNDLPSAEQKFFHHKIVLPLQEVDHYV